MHTVTGVAKGGHFRHSSLPNYHQLVPNHQKQPVHMGQSMVCYLESPITPHVDTCDKVMCSLDLKFRGINQGGSDSF